MAFDFKREHKELYLPKAQPSIVTVPRMNYVAVRGQGDPNDEGGEYQASMEALYGISYAVKMSKRGGHRIEGYFDFVVPPLEGFWWQDGVAGVDYAHKEDFRFISCIRLPDFVTTDDFAWARAKAGRKKRADFSKAEFLTLDEGLCAQCLHLGPYDDGSATVGLMHAYIKDHGYVLDITDDRRHHEIYLSDARKVVPEKRRTVIRHPIRKV